MCHHKFLHVLDNVTMLEECEASCYEWNERAALTAVDVNATECAALAESGEAADISETKVLETWFAGEKVYSSTE